MRETSQSRPLLLGHRGASKYVTENSLPAFDLALKHGCDGFEFDVRYTSDGRTVLCHDPFLNALEIAETSYAELCRSVPPQELANLRSSHTPGSSVSSAAMASRAPQLARLEDVIQHYGPSAFLDIELKVEGDIAQWMPFLKSHPPKKGYVVSSFVPEVLMAIHHADPAIPLGLIVGSREGEQLAVWHELPVSTLILNSRLVVPAVVEDLHRAGKRIYVWTVNDQREMLELAGLGVDGIISDDTKLLAHTFTDR
ncbi:MAG TPA: glycerophosphodiester phosphodiesterase [Terriglobales bacterium]